MASVALDRVRRYRQRALVRAWQYRQRHHAHGVWFRLRRLLAGSSAAHEISAPDAEALLGEGYLRHSVGDELAPRRVLLVVPAERVARIESARPVPVRIGQALLAAECLALTPFEQGDARFKTPDDFNDPLPDQVLDAFDGRTR